MNEAYNIRAPKCTYKMSYQAGKNRREHQIIAEIMIGRPLKPNEVVHHIDGNKANNAKANLIICTHSYHIALHHKLEASKSWPQFEKIVRRKPCVK